MEKKRAEQDESIPFSTASQGSWAEMRKSRAEDNLHNGSSSFVPGIDLIFKIRWVSSVASPE